MLRMVFNILQLLINLKMTINSTPLSRYQVMETLQPITRMLCLRFLKSTKITASHLLEKNIYTVTIGSCQVIMMNSVL
jgi:hypothetical protein